MRKLCSLGDLKALSKVMTPTELTTSSKLPYLNQMHIHYAAHVHVAETKSDVYKQTYASFPSKMTLQSFVKSGFLLTCKEEHKSA